MQEPVWINLWKTIQMVLIAGALTILFGVPLGILLNITDKAGLKPNAFLNRCLGVVTNIGRSIPFIIFVFILMEVTRRLVGGTIGVKGAIVPLTVSAVPFMARLTETALKEVPQGLVEAAHSMGATPMQVIRKVLFPEALPGIMSAMTIMLVSMIDYSAMAGMVGAGGLGDYAINHGYQRGRPEVIFAAVIVIVLLVQITQWAGDWLARKVNHR
ncbi:MAG: methionine ABC transporter permease [Saezia sp.]